MTLGRAVPRPTWRRPAKWPTGQQSWARRADGWIPAGLWVGLVAWVGLGAWVGWWGQLRAGRGTLGLAPVVPEARPAGGDGGQRYARRKPHQPTPPASRGRRCGPPTGLAPLRPRAVAQPSGPRYGGC